MMRANNVSEFYQVHCVDRFTKLVQQPSPAHLSKHAHSTISIRIDEAGHLKAIAVNQVLVCGGHGKDDGVRIYNELHAHTPNLLLNISRLVT